MKVGRLETTIVPLTDEGRKFAEEYAERLKSQGAFMDMCENETYIGIIAKYFFDIVDDAESEEGSEE